MSFGVDVLDEAGEAGVLRKELADQLVAALLDDGQQQPLDLVV